MDLVHPAVVSALAVAVPPATLATLVALLARGLRRSGARLGPADLVTLVRAVLTCVVAGYAVQALTEPGAHGTVVAALGASALVLDGVDGWVARRTGTAGPLGARFDMEVDALLVLVLSLYVAASVGWWVLLIGLARYLLLVAQALWPALRGEVAPRRHRKVVAVVQGVVLVTAASGLLPGRVAAGAAAVSLVLLLASFGGEVHERLTGAPAPLGVAVTVLAVVLCWAALAAPPGGEVSATSLLRVPVEGVVLVGVALLLPERWGRRLAVPFGVLAAVLLLVKVLDVGFTTVLDRPFDPVGDWGYFGPAVGVLGDSVGRPVALAVAVLAAVGAVLVVVAVTLSARRVVSQARRHRRGTVRVVAVLAVSGLLLGVSGLVPGGEVFTTTSARMAAHEVGDVRFGLHDRAVFAREIADDGWGDRPGDRLLQRLRGKDVLLVFVESYGRSAVEGSSYAPGVTRVLDAGTRRLRRAGWSARSAFLTSPTFGAGSWLAHATTQSGLWVDSQRRHDQLLAADRLTLSSAFERAGWRTVLAVPANTEDWPQGEAFYGFDATYDARTSGYRGPKFGYAPMPDQYTLLHLRRRELRPGPRAPVMAEVDLISSHHPWAPLPRMLPWRGVGDGSSYDGMPEEGESEAQVFRDPDRVREAYGQSIEYSIRSTVSFLTRFGRQRRDLVVVMLGDHEPHHYVSGADPGHDVPVSILTRDPAVLADVEGWGWRSGLRPDGDAPVWRMDSLRDRFLAAFSGRRVPADVR